MMLISYLRRRDPLNSSFILLKLSRSHRIDFYAKFSIICIGNLRTSISSQIDTVTMFDRAMTLHVEIETARAA